MAASGGGLASEPPQTEVFQWLKNLPLAPEYHPTLAEFRDPISYIFKIEKEASKYGICKIVPPVLQSPPKTAISNLNRSLAARAGRPTFTTRQQQVGFCPRRPRPVKKPVWQSGEEYTFLEFEAKAKWFGKNYLKKWCKKGSLSLSPLEIETLYWKATVDKPFSVEYANDMPGSAFSPRKKQPGTVGEEVTVGDTEWNMRGVSRAKGSLLRFMKEEIPGVTSPMVYMAMLFSWFAWHVEDHDLHSLNYLHMGAGKTWYGVPKEAAVAFEEVVRVHGHGGEINPLVTFAILGEKTTVMSPEVFISAGVPCCRLVQNAGEFVVTFPRAYHSGFSHGFNCGEAANIATPEWLMVAKDSAIRRASINYPPMVSHYQLLYDLAKELCTRLPVSISAKPRSSRLKDKQKDEGEALVKELFVKNVMRNNELLHLLGNGSSVVLLPCSSSDISVCSKLRVGSQLGVSPSLELCNHKGFRKSLKNSVSESVMPDGSRGASLVETVSSVKGKFDSFYERNKFSSLIGNENMQNTKGTEKGCDIHGDKLSDQRLFSCVTCGILSFDCVAVIEPKEAAAKYLMSADCSFNDWIAGSTVTRDAVVGGDTYNSEQTSSTRWVETSGAVGLYDGPVQAASYQNIEVASNLKPQKHASALGLLALAYGNSSDSEDDQVHPDASQFTDEIDPRNMLANKHQSEASALSSFKLEFRDDANGSQTLSLSRSNNEDEVAFRTIDCHAMDGRKVANSKDGNVQTCDHSVDFEICNAPFHESNNLKCSFKDQMSLLHLTSNRSPVVQDTEIGAIVTKENMATSFAQRSDANFSHMHVFCLEHAVEVEQQLRAIGGVHILLLCHPEYPRIEAKAKLVSEELGIDYVWNDISFRDATKEDEERIQLALDSEEAMAGYGDWAVKMGINLFHSANLSQSPLYSKQMPYNSVIYNAFGRTSPSSLPTKFNVYRRRQKKVVAGRWCGKVWLSNQVHPFLAKRDLEDQVEEQELERSFRGSAVPAESFDRKAPNILKDKSCPSRKSRRKREVASEGVSVKKVKCLETEDARSNDSTEQNFHKQPIMIHRSKRPKGVKGEVLLDSLENNSCQLHGRICRIKQVKLAKRDDSVSNDSLEDLSQQQYKRSVRGKESKCVERVTAASHSLVRNKFLKQRRGISKIKQAKSIAKEDGFSGDSLEDNSHRWVRRVPRSRGAMFIDREYAVLDDLRESSRLLYSRSKKGIYSDQEDSASDDSQENSSQHQLRSICRVKQSDFMKTGDVSLDDSLEENTNQLHIRDSRSKRARFTDTEDVVSDDSIEDNTHWRQRRILRSKQRKFVESEDAISDESVENSTHRNVGRICRNKKANFFDPEDTISDGSLVDTTHRRHLKMTRGKKERCTDREDVASDDELEDNVYQQSRKTLKGKQARFIEREDSVSNDTLKDNSNEQHRGILRSKQKKPLTLSQMTRRTTQRVKQGTRRPVKEGTPQERQTKRETPRIRNIKREQGARQSDSHVEELKGGFSTRLRKRAPKLPNVSETKIKGKQQSNRKKVKEIFTAKPLAGRKNTKVKKEEVEYQCDIEGCTMSFASKQELAVHKRNVCPVKGCGKKFFSHKYLVQHRRVHLDDRPLKCPWKGCKMTFKWAWARTEHIRVHTGARPYVCSEEGCGQTFRFVSDFSRHKRKTGHSAKRVKG